VGIPGKPSTPASTIARSNSTRLGKPKRILSRILVLAWSSLDDPPEVVVKCPSCFKDSSHPWTNWDRREKWGLETTARGFTDKDYEGTCPHCKSRVRHDTLRLSNFRKDIMALKMQDIPLPGTILNKYGIDLYKYL